MVSRNLQSAHPLLWAVVVSGLAQTLSVLLPEEHAASAVGLLFLAATYFLTLSRNAPHPPSHYGLSFGGLMEDQALSLGRLARDTGQALVIATLVSALVLPPFYLGFVEWYEPTSDFSFERAFSLGSSGEGSVVDLMLGHLLVVALSEEAFFRGYLQTALDDRWQGGVSLRGKRIGLSLLVTSAVFALGHLLTIPDLGRLAVFFPSLLFGLLRIGTGGIGASIFFHAQCNLASAFLGRGFGLY